MDRPSLNEDLKHSCNEKPPELSGWEADRERTWRNRNLKSERKQDEASKLQGEERKLYDEAYAWIEHKRFKIAEHERKLAERKERYCEGVEL